MDMVGPAGRGGCSRFTCLDQAAVSFVYRVAWPTRDVYSLVYHLCEGHEQEHVTNRYHYPHMTLLKETRHEGH